MVTDEMHFAMQYFSLFGRQHFPVNTYVIYQLHPPVGRLGRHCGWSAIHAKSATM